MKNLKYYLMALAGVALFNACDDDELVPGNPKMDFSAEPTTALFGDSLPFTIKATDVEVPLSTLKAQLYFNDEKVSETVIRTKVSGQDYTGKIYIPYLQNIPNGTATLKFILQNINFTITEKEFDLPLSRPNFEYLTFVTADGEEYTMTPTGNSYEYSVTGEFSQKVKGYIKSPKAGANGNNILFGWESGAITQGTESPITFSSSQAGEYTITFNTYTYEASPFVKLKVNENEMEMIDDDNYSVDLSLAQGETLTIEGIPGLGEWWIDPDFFEKNDDGTLKFLPISGTYRITANYKHSWLIVESISGSDLATLQEDGSGALWIKGNGIGKPSYTANQVGWDEHKGLCMSQIEAKKYQVTVTAGRQINAGSIDFKFFHQNGWGGEFGGDVLTTNSDVVMIGLGKDVNGVDNGNLALVEGKTLDMGGVYRFTVDLTAGSSAAVLTVEKIGEDVIESATLTMNGEEMEMVEPENYAISASLTQGQTLAFGGIDNPAEWYIDPDYFEAQADGSVKFLPVGGDYKVKANTANKLLSCVRQMNGADATLQSDGTGAIWLMGWGVGHPNQDSQFGFNEGQAYCMAEVSPKVYQFTGQAGPEKESSIGHRFRTDYLSFKFFHQNGWGGEFANNGEGKYPLTIVEGADLILSKDDGNFELHEKSKEGDKTIFYPLEENATYVMTIDLTQGNDKGTISFKKK
ncbi:MAG: DUF5125 domain-containing protein [Bacteroides sp.]|nr:DUF5125 domain-containing protein [Bacteroides sp.]